MPSVGGHIPVPSSIPAGPKPLIPFTKPFEKLVSFNPTKGVVQGPPPTPNDGTDSGPMLMSRPRPGAPILDAGLSGLKAGPFD